MKVKNLNNSSIKTKQIIQDTFWVLYKENTNINDISVSLLCDTANINRSTFYAHYDSIYDLVENLIEIDFLNYLDTNSTDETLEQYFESIFAYLDNNEHILKDFMNSSVPTGVLRKLKKSIRERLHIVFKVKKLNNNVKIDTYVTIDGLIEQYVDTIRDRSEFDIQTLQKYALEWVQELDKR